MCCVFPSSQRPGVFQPTLTAFRPPPLQRPVGVLLHAVPERLLPTDGAPDGRLELWCDQVGLSPSFMREIATKAGYLNPSDTDEGGVHA